ncbi:MAG: hypothetical protein HeimAB125_07160 [Candidatus Heimdallarchaeota archaeon AB_125]|nr:MAG: hypothetical protein HeimAB125_07160 [Candidatus Heimdallarchaeota archaeon AB_125]
MKKKHKKTLSSILLFVFILTAFTGLKVELNALQNINKNTDYQINNIRFIYTEDQDRVMGFPSDKSYSVQPFVLDIDDDSFLETIIVGNMEGIEGKVIYMVKNEAIVSGWPLELFWEMRDVETLGRMDLNNGTEPNIIFRYGKEGVLTNETTAFFAVDSEGNINHSWGFELSGSFVYHTIFSDLNDDGEKEFVLLDTNRTVYYLDHLGNNMTNWPIKVNDSTNFIPPVAEDITNDGEKEIIVTTDTGTVYAWFLNGSLVEGFPLSINVTYPGIEEFREAPMIGDFNLDGDKDLFIASTVSYLYGITLNSENNKTWEEVIPLPVYTSTQGIAYDIDNDGYLEILQLYSSGLAIYNATETINQEFLFLAGSNYFGSPAIADLNNDNKVEIIVLSFNFVYILEHDGNLLEQIPNWVTTADRVSPIIYDFDEDNEIEVIHLSRDGALLIKETNDFGIAPWIHTLGSKTNVLSKDSDEDGLFDYEEEITGSEVNNNDSDGDTILDGLEINQYLLNPLVSDIDEDSDSDGLTNIEEVDIYGTNLLNPDSDGDTLPDGDEVYVHSTNPAISDSDEDGLPDNYEILYDSLDPNNPADAQEDPDNDNLVNLDERAIGTHPEDPDSDGDTLLDGDEIDKYYTDPLFPDADFDMDGDGLTNVEEVDIYGTNPSDPDSDLDGYTDKEEINGKSDPLDPTSIPKDRNYKWMYSFIVIVPVTVLSPIYVVRRLTRRRLMK